MAPATTDTVEVAGEGFVPFRNGGNRGGGRGRGRGRGGHQSSRGGRGGKKKVDPLRKFG